MQKNIKHRVVKYVGVYERLRSDLVTNNSNVTLSMKCGQE